MAEEHRSGTSRRARDLKRLLRTDRFGKEVHWHLRLDSTNDRAAELASQGAPEGTLVVAEEQRRGRGREGRVWHSPPHLGLYFSLLLRPGGDARNAPLQTFLAAVALTEEIRHRNGVPATIRWPNDILIRGRKAAGILAECRTNGEGVRDLVVGVGCNLTHGSNEFPVELRDRATSLGAEGGRKISRVRWLAGYLERWERWYQRFFREGPEPLLEAWRNLSPESSGSRIRLDDGQRIRTGWTRGIDTEGALLVEEGEGSVTAFRFGEVRRLQGDRS